MAFRMVTFTSPEASDVFDEALEPVPACLLKMRAKISNTGHRYCTTWPPGPEGGEIYAVSLLFYGSAWNEYIMFSLL